MKEADDFLTDLLNIIEECDHEVLCEHVYAKAIEMVQKKLQETRQKGYIDGIREANLM